MPGYKKENKILITFTKYVIRKDKREIKLSISKKMQEKFKVKSLNFLIPKKLEKLVNLESIKMIKIGKVKDGRCKVLVFKKKTFDKKGNIVSQEKVECDILDTEDAKRFLEAIGYIEIMRIIEDDVCYSKDGLGLVLKNVKNGDNLIEVETCDIEGLKTIEDLKEKVLRLNLPIDTSNFFVKKAENELEKILNK